MYYGVLANLTLPDYYTKQYSASMFRWAIVAQAVCLCAVVEFGSK